MIDTMDAGIAHRAKEIIDEFGNYWAEGRLVYNPPLVKPKHRKPLSHRRAVEFRGRYLRRMFGPAKVRAERRAMLVARYGRDWEEKERNARAMAKLVFNATY